MAETQNSLSLNGKQIKFSTSCIGKGSYGQVFAGMYAGRRVAVKKQTHEGCAKEVMLREIYILKALANELHHVHFLGCVVNVDGVYIVMEQLRMTVRDAIDGNHVFDRRLAVMQLLSGMHALHRRCLMHRDLTPSNVMLTDDNIVRIVDYGLASYTGRRCYTRQMVTLPYRPPEVLVGSAVYTEKIDVWSAGGIVYELATDALPFNVTSELQLQEAFLREWNVSSSSALLRVSESSPRLCNEVHGWFYRLLLKHMLLPTAHF